MDEPRFYQKNWFYYVAWSVVCVGFYAWQIWKLGGARVNFIYIIVDIFLFLLGLWIWLAFFAQFVLPVRTFRERRKIFNRLLTYLSGGHGPAIFIENGRPRMSHEEEKRKGPGVVWLDSASAAVTRTATSFKQTIGPGVHFTEKGEFIASAVDLHIQSQSLGPREQENPFAEKKEEQSEEEYKQIQERRIEVSAWTRDGIEVVPNISVSFKIDAEPVRKENLPGSRFGFDAEAVRKAVTAEGINPNAPSDAPRRRVAWNQLPALVAADLWREYLSKFTLAQLFEATQIPPSPPAPSAAPIPAETQALYTPVLGSSNALAGMLREANRFLARIADRCERREKEPVKVVGEIPKPPPKAPQPEVGKKETALETINRMIKARMTQPEVDVLDDYGRPGEGKLHSPEFDLLRERGIQVKSVSVGNLRFDPKVEEKLLAQWSASWLNNAKAERERIERERGYVELTGQVEAASAYTDSICKSLIKHGPKSPKDTLKVLLLRSRDELVKNDRLHRRASMEREELEDIIQWVERNGA
ncbi:MAG: hypothetical protein Fur0043_03340 [Anaerolineales bacterium]